jgi:hypothetical protein
MRDSIVFGPKRYVDVEIVGEGVTLLDQAEVALGGFYADPPRLQGRTEEGHRRWSTRAAEEAARHLIRDPGGQRATAPWDEEGGMPTPALRRLVVKTPEMLTLVPESLNPTMGTQFLEAKTSVLRRSLSGNPVALDPGGDLSGWRDLAWFDRRPGAEIAVTTDPTDVSSILIQSLDERAWEYTRPPRSEPIDEVVIDASLIQRVGRVSGVIDAELDGLDNVDGQRLVFDSADLTAHLKSELLELGPAAFSRRFDIASGTAQGILGGRAPSRRTLDRYARALEASDCQARTCALADCDVEVIRPNARYCSKAHADRAYRRRKLNRDTGPEMPVDEVVCAGGCGAVLLGAARSRGTCSECLERVA